MKEIKIKKGQMYYTCYLDLSAYDKCTMEIEEWIITSIDKEFVYLTQKIDRITWGKISSKHGDFGFLPNVHKVYKDKILIDKFYDKYSKTKKAACLSKKPTVDKAIKALNSILRRLTQ